MPILGQRGRSLHIHELRAWGLSDAFRFTSEKLLNALDHGKVVSRSRAWCRSSSSIYKSIYKGSELVRILAGNVFGPGWWLGGSISVEV